MPRTLIEECTVMTTGVGPSALDIEPFDALSFHARHAPHSSTAASRSTLIVEWESESPRPRSLEHTTQANGMRRSALDIKLLDAPSLDEWHARTARTLPHASIAPYLWNGAVRRLVHRLTPARSRPSPKHAHCILNRSTHSLRENCPAQPGSSKRLHLNRRVKM